MSVASVCEKALEKWIELNMCFVFLFISVYFKSLMRFEWHSSEPNFIIIIKSQCKTCDSLFCSIFFYVCVSIYFVCLIDYFVRLMPNSHRSLANGCLIMYCELSLLLYLFFHCFSLLDSHIHNLVVSQLNCLWMSEFLHTIFSKHHITTTRCFHLCNSSIHILHANILIANRKQKWIVLLLDFQNWTVFLSCLVSLD